MKPPHNSISFVLTGQHHWKHPCLFLCNSWVKRKTWNGWRKSFSQMSGRLAERKRAGGGLRGVWLTQCGPHRSSPADEVGHVDWGCRTKVAGSIWVDHRSLFSSRFGGNCPRSQWPQPSHLLLLLSNSLCCHGPQVHLEVKGSNPELWTLYNDWRYTTTVTTNAGLKQALQQYAIEILIFRRVLPARSPLRVSQTLQLKSS